MPKKYVIRLTDTERESLNVLLKKNRVSAQRLSHKGNKRGSSDVERG